MWKLATSELLSTFFPTWLWQGREWSSGRIPQTDSYYWGNAPGHPVLSVFYPPQILSSIIGSRLSVDKAFLAFIYSLGLHIALGFVGWMCVFGWSVQGLFGALTLSFGAYSLKQQPCIIYTIAWFPLTLSPNTTVSAIAIGMVILSGYYPFSIYLLPISITAFWLHSGEMSQIVLATLIGLPQLIPFLSHLPKTIKRLTDSCQSPESERRFYVGVTPLLLVPFSQSHIWPLVVLSALFSLGVGRRFFPRVHERWLIVLQFGMAWMSVDALRNLNLNQETLCILTLVHAFDLYWHNIRNFWTKPYVELYQKPSWAFDTKLTRYLEANLGDDYRVSGLPWPLFTGHVNKLRTIGYCGSMQTRAMWSWRHSFRHDPFIDGVAQNDLNKQRILFAISSQKPNRWHTTPIRHLYRNPDIPESAVG